MKNTPTFTIPTGWEAVIGLEVHVQLATRSKIFSGASTAFGAAANEQACAVDLALPGVLPVLNAEAVRMAVTSPASTAQVALPLSGSKSMITPS